MERIERLTRLNVEIEGLLVLLSKRDNSIIRETLNEKYNEFSTLFGEMMAELPENTEEKATDDPIVESGVAASAAVEKVAAPTAEESAAVEKVAAPTAEESFAVEKAPYENVEKKAEESAEEESHEVPGAFDDIDESEIVPIELGEFPIDDEPVEESVKEPIDEPVNEPVKDAVVEQTPVEDETSDNTPVKDEPSDTTTDEPENATLGDRLSEEMSPEIRVDEMIARRAAGDLTKAFTLNDKIRFRRSLFASDADAFARVLNDLSCIETYSEATSYLIDTLGWDMNNPEAEEFLAIIRPHYPKAD